MLAVLLLAVSSFGNYLIHYQYADKDCTKLMSIKSEKYNENQDDTNDKNNNQQEYDEDYADYMYEQCAVIYEKLQCSKNKAKISGTDTVLVTSYEDGCADKGYKPISWLSIKQGCLPVKVFADVEQQQDDKNNNKNYQGDSDYDQDGNKREVYYYQVSCDKYGEVSMLQCLDSACEECIMMSTYKEQICYGFDGDLHMSYECQGKNHEVTTLVTLDDDTIEINRTVFMAVSLAAGIFILGGIAMAGFFYSISTKARQVGQTQGVPNPYAANEDSYRKESFRNDYKAFQNE
eukprot:g78179.t1